MANQPKKTIDPTEAALSATEAALSAIQESLNSHQEEEDIEPAERIGPPRVAPEDRPSFAPNRRASERFASAGRDMSNLHARDLRAQVTRPANDDRQSVGQILRALQRRPAQTSYVVAATCSGAWLIGCFALSWAYLSNLNAALGPNHSSAAVMIGLGALALLPIIFFFGVAHMAWRAQELRLIVQAMAGVAMRLAEPEAVAQDGIVSVGQAIRREVAAMGDGVERALARASELEAMVHNEVAALARAYDDNEARIRGLMQDLGTQRDTLVSQAEQVRSAINNVHIDLTQDLSTISELVEQQVNDAAQRITTSLAEKGEHITLSLSKIGDNMIDQLSVGGGDLLERLETVRAETTRAIASASDRLNASLGFKTDHIGAEFAEIAQGLDDMLTARLDRVTEHFSEKSLAVVDTMVARSQELTDLVDGRAREFTGSIIETSSQVAGQIAASTEQVSNTLKASGESLVLDLNLRGGEIATRLEQTGAHITDSLVSRSNKLADSVRESAEHLVSVVTSRSDAVKELLSTRLASYEEKLSQSGLELGEKISRNASSLGNLIARHLTEFDRTVKSYGGELVERLGARTQEISDSMRGHIENFDSKIGSRANEVTTSFDERLSRFQETFDGRTQTLTEALSARVLDIAKTLNEGGKEVADAIDKRGVGIAALIDSHGQQFAASVGERLAAIERTLGAEAAEVANTLDERIERLEKLLLGRTQAVIAEMDTHSRAAADMLNARLVELSDSIKTNSTAAERTLSELVANTTEALGKTAAASSAATEALNRSATGATAILQQSATAISSTLDKSTIEAAATLNRSTGALGGLIDKSAVEAAALLDRSAGALSTTIRENAAAASDAIEKSTAASSAALDQSTASATEVISRTAAMAGETIGKTTATAADLLAKTANESSEAISRSAGGAEQMLSRINSEIMRNVGERAERIEAALSQRVGEMTRVLDDKSAEMTRALDQSSAEMTRALDEQSTQITRTLVEKSGDVLNVFSGRGEQFASEITRVTDQAVKAIEAKGFVFTQTMMDNSEEIARLVNSAAQNAAAAVTRTLGEFQEGTQGAAEAAKTNITQTLEHLHGATGTAIEEAKKTAAATVADMLETHGMLRSDSTALFERLREANNLLQEVLRGAHENMTAIERTMGSRVSEFVAAMNELNSKSGTAGAKLEEHLGAFNTTTVKVLSELGTLATQFTAHGRALAEAAELLERSNRHTEDKVASRHAAIEALVATLDARTDDFDQRLRRFSSLLDGSLDSAIVRAREIAGIVTETSNESVQAIEQQFDVVRASADEQRRRTSERMSAAYDATLGEAQAMFSQSAERFAEIMQGMKQMAAQMQRELEATRAELRRGVLELPEETAENAARMRRVIVEQMEALAELNRIVARHGSALDAVVPVRREAEPAYAAGGARRPETGARARPTRDTPPRWPASPLPSPVQDGSGGWLSELLTHASHDDGRLASSSSREAADPLEALSVDIARMIDHEATIEFWDRYQRGEGGLGGRHLYTPEGQKSFEEIRRKYRSDPEFRETVEHYIDEFERLVEDVSRGESGHTVARNYLASDTGKVYTMLAHAAGRFEQ